MGPFVIVRYYLVWHYSRGTIDFFGILHNLLWFVENLFSVKILLRTLFAPFKRIAEDEKVNIIADPGKFFENFLVNTIMRLVGIIVRTALLVIALASFLIMLGLGAAFFVLWLVLPVLVVYLLVVGAQLLI